MIGWFLPIQAFFVLYDTLKVIVLPNDHINAIEKLRKFLIEFNCLILYGNNQLIDVVVVVFILFFKWAGMLIPRLVRFE